MSNVICFYNDPSSGIDTVAFRRYVQAINCQLTFDVAPAWSRAISVVSVVRELCEVPKGAYLLRVVGKPSLPDAQGFHTEQGDGAIDGEVATEGLTPEQIPGVMSHEAIEIRLNPFVNLYSRRLDGWFFPDEGCDAVEGDSYPIPLHDGSPAVLVSNFVLPAWRDEEAKDTKRDHLGLLSRDSAFGIRPDDGYTAAIDPHGLAITLPIGKELPARKQHPRARIQRILNHGK